jgi:hypothetical protein
MTLSLLFGPSSPSKKLAFCILILVGGSIIYFRRSMPEGQFLTAVLLAIDSALLIMLILFVP